MMAIKFAAIFSLPCIILIPVIIGLDIQNARLESDRDVAVHQRDAAMKVAEDALKAFHKMEKAFIEMERANRGNEASLDSMLVTDRKNREIISNALHGIRMCGLRQ